MSILISKRFRIFNEEKFNSIVCIMESIIRDPEIVHVVPLFTPYDLPDTDIKEVQEQFTKTEDLKHIFNIFNYLTNSTLQIPFLTIFYGPETIQKASLWLSLRYFSMNDKIAKQVAIKSLTSNLSDNTNSDEYKQFKRKLSEIVELLELIEMEMVKVTTIVNKAKQNDNRK